MIKINLGIEGAALLAVYLLWRWVAERDALGREIAWASGVGLGILIVAVPTLYGSPRGAAMWLRAQVELARGFGPAMGRAGPGLELAEGLGCLVLLTTAALLAWRSRPRSQLAPVAALALPLALLSFRHGFVRQDVHVVFFFPLIVALFAVGASFARDRREVATAAVGGIVAAALSAAAFVAFHDRLPGLAPTWQSLGSELGWLARPAGARERAAAGSRRLLADSQLPADLVAPLTGRGVDAVPTELSRLPANGLRWLPNPTLQLYTAYTPWLDQRDAMHFTGAGAPDALLVDFESPGGHHPLWDAPLTWQTLLTAYRPDRLEAGALVAVRKERPDRPEPLELGTIQAGLGEWIEVPREDDLVFAAIDLRPSATGRVLDALLRLPAVWIECELRGGGLRRYRAVPGNADAGLLVSPLPDRLRGLDALWRDGSGRRTSRLRIVPDGCAACFVRPVEVRWLSLRLPDPDAAEPPLTPP